MGRRKRRETEGRNSNDWESLTEQPDERRRLNPPDDFQEINVRQAWEDQVRNQKGKRKRSDESSFNERPEPKTKKKGGLAIKELKIGGQTDDHGETQFYDAPTTQSKRITFLDEVETIKEGRMTIENIKGPNLHTTDYHK